MSENSVIRKAGARGAAVTAAGATAVAATGAASTNLVGQLGWDNDAALALVTLLASSGMAVIAVAYPVLAPFIGTLRFLLWTGGTGAIVGF